MSKPSSRAPRLPSRPRRRESDKRFPLAVAVPRSRGGVGGSTPGPREAALLVLDAGAAPAGSFRPGGHSSIGPAGTSSTFSPARFAASSSRGRDLDRHGPLLLEDTTRPTCGARPRSTRASSPGRGTRPTSGRRQPPARTASRGGGPGHRGRRRPGRCRRGNAQLPSHDAAPACQADLDDPGLLSGLGAGFRPFDDVGGRDQGRGQPFLGQFGAPFSVAPRSRTTRPSRRGSAGVARPAARACPRRRDRTAAGVGQTAAQPVLVARVPGARDGPPCPGERLRARGRSSLGQVRREPERVRRVVRIGEPFTSSTAATSSAMYGRASSARWASSAMPVRSSSVKDVATPQHRRRTGSRRRDLGVPYEGRSSPITARRLTSVRVAAPMCRVGTS